MHAGLCSAPYTCVYFLTLSSCLQIPLTRRVKLPSSISGDTFVTWFFHAVNKENIVSCGWLWELNSLNNFVLRWLIMQNSLNKYRKLKSTISSLNIINSESECSEWWCSEHQMVQHIILIGCISLCIILGHFCQWHVHLNEFMPSSKMKINMPYPWN